MMAIIGLVILLISIVSMIIAYRVDVESDSWLKAMGIFILCFIIGVLMIAFGCSR